MITIGALAAVVLVRARDAIGVTGSVDVPPWLGVLLLLGAIVCAVLVAWARVLVVARRLDTVGDLRGVRSAERWVLAARVVILSAHVAAVFALGWVDAVRAVVGDWPLVDELMAAAPALVGLIATAAVWHPIELRLCEARIFRELETGGPVYPPPTLGEHVGRVVRLRMGTLIAPLCVLMFATETVGFAGAWAQGPGGASLPVWARDPAMLEWAVPLGQIAAALVGLTLAPLAIRAVWNAPSLPAGELRASIQRVLDRHGVRVRDVVVWRTGGTITNAAVVGVFPSLRYLALTDGMLDALPEDELEAVTAHEVAHLRLRHVPWLAAAVLAAVSVAGGVLGVAAALTGWDGQVGLIVVTIGTLVAALLALGAVSRRFEWQADVFAAAHLSESSSTLTQDGADAMAAALRRVATLNNADPRRFDWRHGSIDERRQRLADAVGVPLAELPQDRTVRRMLIAAVVLLPVGVGLTVLESILVSAMR
ncbi:MAG: M48 family metalloprotease [Planctomycetota bacterium]